MSFSARVKEELSHQLSKARHCQIAELAAILSLCGKIHIDEEDHFSIRIHTENVAVARKYFTLLKNTFNIKADISIRRLSGKPLMNWDSSLTAIPPLSSTNFDSSRSNTFSLVSSFFIVNGHC